MAEYRKASVLVQGLRAGALRETEGGYEFRDKVQKVCRGRNFLRDIGKSNPR